MSRHPRLAMLMPLVIASVLAGCSKDTPSCDAIHLHIGHLYEDIVERQENGMRPHESLMLTLDIDAACKYSMPAKEKRCITGTKDFGALARCVPAIVAEAAKERMAREKEESKREKEVEVEVEEEEDEEEEEDDEETVWPGLRVAGECHLRVSVGSRSKTATVPATIAVGRWGERCNGILDIDCQGEALQLKIGTNIFAFVDSDANLVDGGRNMKYEFENSTPGLSRMWIASATRLMGRELVNEFRVDSVEASGQVILNSDEGDLRAELKIRAKTTAGQRVSVQGHVAIPCPSGAICRSQCDAAQGSGDSK